MLCEIRIENFAIIDRLEVRFDPGFNVITGETGAGKSIIIDAVDLLLGGRADADFIRAGADRAIVEGVFETPKPLIKEIKALLEGEGIDPLETPNEVILTRELRSNGRNTCRINGSNASLQFFRSLGEKLVDIHGQSEHLSLLRPREHIHMLDRYANLDDQRSAVTVVVKKLTQVHNEISNLEQDEAALARRIDMLGYQIEEIKAVAPQMDEEEALKEERTRLANAEQLASLTAEAQRTLFEGSDDTSTSAVDLLGQAAVLLAKLAKVDPAFEEQQTLAESLAVQAEELAGAIRAYNDKVEYNPSRLIEVEERLDALNRLKRKYGGTIEAMLAYAQKSAKHLSDITHSEERLEKHGPQETTPVHQIGGLASRLRRAPETAAETVT